MLQAADELSDGVSPSTGANSQVVAVRPELPVEPEASLPMLRGVLFAEQKQKLPASCN